MNNVMGLLFELLLAMARLQRSSRCHAVIAPNSWESLLNAAPLDQLPATPAPVKETFPELQFPQFAIVRSFDELKSGRSIVAIHMDAIQEQDASWITEAISGVGARG